MSASFGLVRFNRTGKVYYGCYEGTSDVMIPYLCIPKECYDDDDQRYYPISYCRHLGDINDWKFPDSISDLDQVEIYSDYGGGFYWPSEGSESVKMIKGNLMPWENCYEDMKYGIPQWASDFLDRE